MIFIKNGKKTCIEAEIIKVDFNRIVDIVYLLIDIKGIQHALQFSSKKGNYALISQLKSKMVIKFNGSIDKENKKIIQPENICVKIS